MKKKIIALALCFVLFCAICSTAFAESVTVIFDAKGGEVEPDNQTIESGNTISIPKASKSGYNLEGWFNGNDEWNFSVSVFSNMTLTARWTPKVPDSYSLNANLSPNVGTVTFKNFDNEAISSAIPGTSIKVEINASSGYTVGAATSDDVALTLFKKYSPSSVAYTFTMPADNVTVSASFLAVTPITSLTLSKSDIMLALSDSTGTTLTATTDPLDAKVDWTIPDFVTATGTDGKTITIVPKGIGDGYIIATAGDKTTQCHIRVSSVIPADSIIFTLPTSKITDKTPFTLTATVTPPSCTEPVQWFVSPSDVLSLAVDSTNSRNVTVTPLKNGSCEITARCGNRSCVRTIDVAFISDYAVVYNKNGSWYYDAPTDYTIQTKRPFTTGGIKSIVVTNKYNGLQYTAIEGSDFIAAKAKNSNDTVISFYKDFMKSLPHYKNQLITVTYNDGTTSKTGLHILSVKDRPITGDTDYSPYVILLAVSAAGLGAVLTLRRKQKI